MPAARRGALLVAAAAVCWSSGGLIVRLVHTDSWTTSLWRSLFASVVLAVVLSALRRRSIFAQWHEGGRGPAGRLVHGLASTCFILLAHTSVANRSSASLGPYWPASWAGCSSASGLPRARGWR
jgi:drug/metabolite transporter (DMT)-like permease